MIRRRLSPLVTFLACVGVWLAAMITYAGTATAAPSCSQLKAARVYGITGTKQYLKRSQIKLFRNSGAAKRRSYTAIVPCSGISSIPSTEPVSARSAARCAMVTGIKADKLYVPISRIKVFRTVNQAKKKGYAAYSTCPGWSTPTPIPEGAETPTPTATPTATPSVVITPVAGAPVFAIDNGVRHAGAFSSTTVRLENGTYRAYLGMTDNAFLTRTIASSTSNDGLTWGARAYVTGMDPGASQAYVNPSALFLGGQFVLVVQRTTHIGSAGVDFHSFFRAVSANGNAMSLSPAGALLDGDYSTYLQYPDIVSLGGTQLRLYFRGASSIESALSLDSGVSWAREGAVAIAGTSSSFATYPNSPDVVKLADGRFRMFFDSPPNGTSLNYTIYSAVSADGRSFIMEQGPVLAVPDTGSYVNPDAVLLPDGSWRLYFSRRVAYGSSDIWSAAAAG